MDLISHISFKEIPDEFAEKMKYQILKDLLRSIWSLQINMINFDSFFLILMTLV